MIQKTLKSKAIFGTIALLAVSAIFSAEVSIDDFEGETIKHWSVWPGDGSTLKFSDDASRGKKSLKFDFREKSGVATRLLPASLKGMSPHIVSFWIKAAKGNQKEAIEVLLQEGKGGEKYYQIIKPTQEWKRHELKFSDFKIYPYGGSKVVDGKLDFNDIISIRFSSYPNGAVFLLDDITISTGGSVVNPEEAKGKDLTIKINHIKLSEEYPDYRDRYPAKVRNVEISGGNFYRDGHPIFLMGGWAFDNEGPPWLFRTLGIDIYPYNADEIYTLYPPKIIDDTAVIEWRENPWYEAFIDRTLKNGILFWHEHKAHPRWNQLNKYFPEIVDAGHFVPYDPFNQIGEDFYKEMYKSWMRYTRKYPIFCYELFNEMGYHNAKLISRNMFQEEMQEKYKDVKMANSAWGTSFQSFNDVQPPGFILNKGKVSSNVHNLIMQQEAIRHPNLQIDWLKFQEKSSEYAIARLMKIMRGYDNNSSTYSTLQSHCQLFFDYGDAGINPKAIEKCTDFYSHEVGNTFFNQNLRETTANAKRMTVSSMTCDIIRNVCKKPIVNGEAPIGISSILATPQELEETDMAKLHGIWKFYDASADEPSGWMDKDFNDLSWNEITVPGMWGKQGYEKCQVGLYRKNFKFSAKSLEQGIRIFINGKAFADKSKIYLNGKFVGETEGFQSSFSFDVTKLLREDNVIATVITNKYFSNGMYFGGIRGGVSLNNYPSTVDNKPSIEPKHFRAHLWSQIVHGMSGVIVSYDSILYTNAAKIIPRVKKEIESIADIVLPRPRIHAQVAFVYPFETNRGIGHSGYVEKISGPATSDFGNYYTPMLLSGLGVDVICNQDIVTGRADRYQAIVMSGNIRTQPKVIESLEKYINNGGILIADFGSLSVDDNTHHRLNIEKLFGIKVKSFGETTRILATEVINPETKTRFADKKSFADIETVSATSIMNFKNGSPAVTVCNSGKGKAYYVAGCLSYEAIQKILTEIFSSNGLKPPVQIAEIKDGRKPKFIETNLFRQNERYVLYVLNYGRDTQVELMLPTLANASYRIRNISSGNILQSPSKKELWSYNDLNGKFMLDLPSLVPVVLLIEKSNLKPLVLKNISPERLNILEQLWTDSGISGNEPVVAFSPIQGMTANFGDHPTAVKLLEINGFKTESYVRDKTRLDRLNVLIWTHAKHKPNNIESILTYVKNGGGLLICGNGIINFHNTTSAIEPLLNAFQFEQQWLKWFKTSAPDNGDDMLNVKCTDIVPHEITKYVKEFKTSCSGPIICHDPKAKKLIKAPADSNYPGDALLAAMKYGKGRVVFIGDAWWLRPFNIDKADNAQLFLNIVNWLSGRPVVKLDETTRDKALYISPEKLEVAEKAEEQGKFIFHPFKRRTSALGVQDDLKGMAGGDPIVDALK